MPPIIICTALPAGSFTGAAQVSEVHGKAPAVSQRTASGPFRTALGIPAASPASEPLRRTPFIGRYAELSELLGLISMARVVTLAGAPGLGKTRLAQEVARRLAAHFRDGVAWVSLSPQVPPDSLVRRVARATKLESAHDVSTPEQLAAAIGARRLLLIVDCCGSSRASVGELVECAGAESHRHGNGAAFDQSGAGDGGRYA